MPMRCIKAHSINGKKDTMVAPPPDYTFLYDDRQIRIGRFIRKQAKNTCISRKTLTYQTIQVGTVALAISQQKILESGRQCQALYLFSDCNHYSFRGGDQLAGQPLFFAPDPAIAVEGTRAIRSGDFRPPGE
jgi:hypothetical protein